MNDALGIISRCLRFAVLSMFGCVLCAFFLVGCVTQPLLAPLDVSGSRVRANGLGIENEIRVLYTLSDRANIAIELTNDDGKTYVLRDRTTRAPDVYELRFDGTVPREGGERRVLPDGQYLLAIVADTSEGRREQREVIVTIVDADTVPVEIIDLKTDRSSFSPDGSGVNDEVRISYRLTKDAEATVFLTDVQGHYFVIDPWTKRRAALQSHAWDGTTGGRVRNGKLLSDGEYTVHVESRDAAGNFSSAKIPITLVNGGTPRLVITDVRFSPIAIILGGTLDVRITAKNTGTVPLNSWGPAPGHVYSAPSENFASIRDPADPSLARYFERRGIWRVGVTWQNAPNQFPLRWGLYAPTKKADGSDDWDQKRLMPGESVTVNGAIRVFIKENSRQVRFSAGIIQEGVGFTGGAVGEQLVQVGW